MDQGNPRPASYAIGNGAGRVAVIYVPPERDSFQKRLCSQSLSPNESIGDAFAQDSFDFDHLITAGTSRRPR